MVVCVILAGVTELDEPRSANLALIFEYVSFVAEGRPLSEVLDEVPGRLCRLLQAEICSIYLLEGDQLVMRGAVGFPAAVLGDIRLALGEGLTGLAVQMMSVVSAESAPGDARYRDFPELHEERYPIFVAIPIAGPRGPLGAVVLQRGEGNVFSPTEIQLAAALTGSIATVIERARLPEAVSSTRRLSKFQLPRVTLPGRPIRGGANVGLVKLAERPMAESTASGVRLQSEIVARLKEKLDETGSFLDSRLEALRENLVQGDSALEVAKLYLTILDDSWLRERTLQQVAQGESLATALCGSGAEAVKAASKSDDEFVVKRAQVINDLCEAWAFFLERENRTPLRKGTILVVPAVSIIELLRNGSSMPAALVVVGEVSTSWQRQLVGAYNCPVVSEAVGVYRWLQDGDRVMVDGNHGLVRLNPGRAEIAMVRARRRRTSENIDPQVNDSDAK